MEVTREKMLAEGFLLACGMIPLDDDQTRGLHFGRYGLEHFQDAGEFARYTMQVSSATQDWYSYGSLDLSFVETTGSATGSAWVVNAQSGSGSLREFVRKLDVAVDLERLPDLLAKEMYWEGDREEFGLIARCAEGWVELFIADRTDA